MSTKMNLASLGNFQRVFLKSIKVGGADPSHLGIKEGGALSAQERLGVYHRDYWIRQIQSLEEDFPRVRKALGKKFNKGVEEFLTEKPSQSWTLAQVGERFPGFLAKRFSQRIAAAARLDWAEVLASVAPELPQMRPQAQDKSAIQVVKLSPSVQRVGTWVVWRKGDQVHSKKISREDSHLFDLLKRPRSVSSLARVLRSPAKTYQWFKYWSAQGVVRY